MRKLLVLFLLLMVTHTVFAQEKIEQDKTDQEKRDWKLNLFTGGTVSLGFFNNTFLIGANPVFGYSLTNWADAGLQVNYTYNAVRNYDYNGVITSRLRETIFGGGPFLRLYPVRFLFAQVQLEHNFIRQKSIPLNGPADTWKRDVGSVLIGGGYTSGRFGRGGGSFYYLSVLADVSGNALSPYTDAYGRAVPVFRAGLQIPLFQGQGNRYER
jgi:hypothetical protein